MEEINGITYHSIHTMSKNRIIEQWSNDANSSITETTDFFDTGEENLEKKEYKKKNSASF